MKLFGAPIGKCLFAFLLLAIIFQLAISACRSSRQGFYEGAGDFEEDGLEEGFYEGQEEEDFSEGEGEFDDDGFQEGFDEGFYEGNDGASEEEGDGFQEGFTGSDLNYQMGRGVVLGGGGKAWDQRKMGGSRGPQTQGGYKLPPTRMAIFDGVRFAPECCPSAYSNSTGCVCAPKNLERYVAETRAGNNTKNCTSF